MKLHRFYVGEHSLTNNLELKSEKLLLQWSNVLRFRQDQELILFNLEKKEAVYKILDLSKKIAKLQKISNIKPNLPSRHMFLFWSLLKRDNNEHVIQKCTELGVTNFIPVITSRTIKKDFNLERAQKIIIEASEQCGRADVPSIISPIKLIQAIAEYKDKTYLFVAQQEDQSKNHVNKTKGPVGVFIGPEGGWTSDELLIFENNKIDRLGLGKFTLRAETAAIVASSKLL